ncbi:MAG: DUF4350 domain-containing protein, partial [Acidobacteriota bacterium]|nr:DUF4350 domain-containing protein [Acidobacteriota bacterium]
STSALTGGGAPSPEVFVFVGQARREMTDTEIESLLRWVSKGGRLVVIDREPPSELVKTTADWKISTVAADAPDLSTDPSDIKQMTAQTPAAKPAQPTVFTAKVNAAQASRFASRIEFERLSGDTKTISSAAAPSPAPVSTVEVSNKSKDGEIKGIAVKDAPGGTNDSPAPTAPVAHVVGDGKTLLADFPFGAGRIVYLSDPFIVSNGGISLADNAQLAINLVATNGGIIAFDEFHQGYGAGQNRLLEYFAGTPLTAVALQIFALIAVIFYTQSRRFARPLPSNESNRLSKLEYVGAMAELQQRTKAYDLAMENIYKDFRRRASRLVGTDALKTKSEDLAALIAERIKLDDTDIADTLAKCEAIMHGEPTNKKQMLDLTSRLRDIEERLGLQRRKRQDRIS